MPLVHHRFAQVGQHRVFYREAGRRDAPTIVLLHGAPASSFMFRDLIPLLAVDHRVIAPDLVGFGLSDAPPADEFTYDFDALTDITAALLDQLEVDRFSMYVQDYGAPVGWRLALRRPERITAIVSQNGNAYREGFVEDFWAPLWRYASDPSTANAVPMLASLEIDTIRWQYTNGVPDQSLISPDAWIHDAALVARPGNAEVQLALYADYPSNVDLYPAVQRYFRESQVPLLAVWGRNDEIFGPDGARAFQRDLPNARVELLNGGHFLLESAVDEVAELMHEFLADVETVAGTEHPLDEAR